MIYASMGGNISPLFFSIYVETTAPDRATVLCGGLDKGLWLSGDHLGDFAFLVLSTKDPYALPRVSKLNHISHSCYHLGTRVSSGGGKVDQERADTCISVYNSLSLVVPFLLSDQ